MVDLLVDSANLGIEKAVEHRTISHKFLICPKKINCCQINCLLNEVKQTAIVVSFFKLKFSQTNFKRPDSQQIHKMFKK